MTTAEELEKWKLGDVTLKSLVLAGLKNHIFSFNGKIYHEMTSGGAIPKINKLYILKPMPLGSRFRNDHIEIENDRLVPVDLITAKILQKIGNSICPPPILDLKTRIVINQVDH